MILCKKNQRTSLKITWGDSYDDKGLQVKDGLAKRCKEYCWLARAEMDDLIKYCD